MFYMDALDIGPGLIPGYCCFLSSFHCRNCIHYAAFTLTQITNPYFSTIFHVIAALQDMMLHFLFLSEKKFMKCTWEKNHGI